MGQAVNTWVSAHRADLKRRRQAFFTLPTQKGAFLATNDAKFREDEVKNEIQNRRHTLIINRIKYS